MRRALISLLALAATQPALAHHSLAMFDQAKTETLTGTVYKFDWTNPHVWLWVSVPGVDKPAIWGLETGAPPQLRREGIRWDSFHAGNQITVTLHPTRDGSTGGHLLSAAVPTGAHFQSHEPPPPPDPP